MVTIIHSTNRGATRDRNCSLCHNFVVSNHRVSIIAAIGKNRELGKMNELIWRISDDLKRFKTLTMGHPIIMGRKTYESIGKPLPGRTNIIVSRMAPEAPGCTVVNSFVRALDLARNIDQQEVFIIGGAQIYAEALPLSDRLYLTLIDDTNAHADAFFPPYPDFTRVVSSEPHEDFVPPYRWSILERA